MDDPPNTKSLLRLARLNTTTTTPTTDIFDYEAVTHRTSNDPFHSLANISGWSKAWWTLAWDAINDLDMYTLQPNQINVDETWSFIVRVVLATEASPIEVADTILTWYGTETISQHLQRL